MRYFYWYLYVLLWLFACIAPYINLKAQKRLLALYCAIWAFVFGFRRYDVGNDTPGYAAFFENKGRGLAYGTINRAFDDAEEGFVFLSRIINMFTDNATVVFLFIGVVLWFLIYTLYKNKSKTPLLSLLVMMTITGRMFYTLEIAVRQTTSIIFVLGGILLIGKSGVDSWIDIRKNKMAIIGILLLFLSVTIHRTTGFIAVILAVIYFVPMTKLMAYSLIAFFTGIAVFASEKFADFFDSTMLIMGGMSDENASLLGHRYFEQVEAGHFGWSTILGWVVTSVLGVYLSSKKHVNTYYFKLFIFTVCLHMLMQFSTMHDRLVTLFLLLGFTASVPVECRKNNWLYGLYMLLALYFVAYIDFKAFVDWPVKIDSAVPYYFIWQ